MPKCYYWQMEVCLKNEKAFTLAEVLITLGIIGIVAEMTIPILMQNVQDAQFKAAMKKTFQYLMFYMKEYKQITVLLPIIFQVVQLVIKPVSKMQ